MAESTDSDGIAKSLKLFGDIFTYNPNTKKSTCQIVTEEKKCGISLTGCRPFNLKRHISSVHKDFNLKDLEINHPRTCITKTSILNACSELISINGRPYSILEDSGFKFFLGCALSILEGDSRKTTINIQNVQSHMSIIKEKMIKKIISETKNNLVSGMIDTATKNRKSILGLNIQYSLNGVTTVRTLGMKHLTRSHTGEYLAESVKEVLASFEISPKQLYSMTTDNARNMLLSQSILDELSLHEDIENIYEDLNFADVEEEFFYNLLKEAEREFFKIGAVAENVNSLSCAAHTFQLAINDALKLSSNSNSLIDKCRGIIKRLRTPTISNAMILKKLKTPLLDVPTRWSSKYLMVIITLLGSNWFRRM